MSGAIRGSEFIRERLVHSASAVTGTPHRE